MVAGGNDTTGNLISHGVMLLDCDHASRERLVAAPELIPSALVEFLRLESSVQGLARCVTRPVTVCGVDIDEGTKVMMLFGSANRDEREFGDDADRLDITRDVKRHLAFSSGAHFCIGSHFAKLQARVAFEQLLARQPHIGVDVEAGTRLHSSFTRGWLSLPATGLATGLDEVAPGYTCVTGESPAAVRISWLRQNYNRLQFCPMGRRRCVSCRRA